jgi:hypothetical protein
MEWRAVPIAGFAAGTVYLLLVALLAPVLGLNLSVFLRYCASLVMGSGAVTSTDTAPLLVGMLTHYALSIFYALLIAIVVHRWGLLVGILGGAILGLCIYAINYFTLTLAFPWMFALNTPVLLVCHVAFGAVAGGVYETLDRYDRPLVTEEGAS